jgi:hypothetical protein
MLSKEFNDILHEVRVKFVIVQGFGYKANLDMCQELMILAKKADPECKFVYDMHSISIHSPSIFLKMIKKHPPKWMLLVTKMVQCFVPTHTFQW